VIIFIEDGGAYHYNDPITYTGRLYYRLKMVDANGSFTYSAIISLVNEGNSSISIYPNPATNAVTINAGNELLHTSARLYNANGRLLQTIVITANTQVIAVQQLVSGVYMLQFENGTTEKFIKK
jgi:hypothetical protein